MSLPSIGVDVSVITTWQPDIIWACDTNKCIDGAPILTRLSGEEIVVACSHSGVVVCIRIRDGYLMWKTLIQCRFEASPTICGKYFVVGGYDGGIYFLSAATGVTEWRFACGDVVKAACTVDDNNHVYVPAYNRKLYKIDPKNKECVWSCTIQSGSPANAVIVKKCVLTTTIKGSLEAVDVVTGMHLWIYQVHAPVFSSVTVHDDWGFVGSVDGMITKASLKNGKKDVAANIQEPIFARMSILNNLLYIVSEKGSLFIADLMLNILHHFRFPFCSFVVPVIIISHTSIGVVSSSGLFITFTESSRTAKAFRLGAGQVFSPAVLSEDKNYLLIGCRDDWLRCFSVQSSF